MIPMVQEITTAAPKVHIFVCVNDRTQRENNTMPSCGPTITVDQFKELKRWVMAQGWTRIVYCTKVSCLGFCNPEGAVACVYPSGKFFKKINNVDDLKKIVSEEVRKL